MKTTKQTISIFVSSTFKDMDTERDWLRKYILPRLESYYCYQNISIRLIDLRWGINTVGLTEKTAERLVLNSCFELIDNNRPLFIAFIGDRYGWIPDKQSIINNEYTFLFQNEEKKSVTEYEIEYATFYTIKDIEHSIFFFRKEDAYKDIPEDILPIYQDDRAHISINEKEEKKRKLKDLKNRIKAVYSKYNKLDSFNDYTLIWDKDNNTFYYSQDWDNMVYNALVREINALISIEHTQYDNWYAIEKEEDRSFISKNIKSFVGRDNILKALKNYMEKEQKIILYGLSGSGKSSVCCKLTEILEHENYFILFNSANLSNNSRLIQYVISKWNMQLYELLKLTPARHYLKYDHLEKVDINSIIQDFHRLIKQANKNNYKICILFDAYEKLNLKDKAIYTFQWIPQNTPCIITSLTTLLDKYMKHIYKSFIVNMPDFSFEESELMIQKICKYEFKTLSPNIIKAILLKKQNEKYGFHSPLWVKLIITVLIELDIFDFRLIRKNNKDTPAIAIENYILQLIKKLPIDSGELFLFIVEKLSFYFGYRLTWSTFYLLSLSRNGLQHKSLPYLLAEDWNELKFMNLRRWFRHFITENIHTKNWAINHDILKKALKLKLAKEQKEIEYIERLRSYYEQLPENDIVRQNELFYYLIKNNKKEHSALYCIEKFDSYIPKEILLDFIYNEEEAQKWIEEWLFCNIPMQKKVEQLAFFIHNILRQMYLDFTLYLYIPLIESSMKLSVSIMGFTITELIFYYIEAKSQTRIDFDLLNLTSSILDRLLNTMNKQPHNIPNHIYSIGLITYELTEFSLDLNQYEKHMGLINRSLLLIDAFLVGNTFPSLKKIRENINTTIFRQKFTVPIESTEKGFIYYNAQELLYRERKDYKNAYKYAKAAFIQAENDYQAEPTFYGNELNYILSFGNLLNSYLDFSKGNWENRYIEKANILFDMFIKNSNKASSKYNSITLFSYTLIARYFYDFNQSDKTDTILEILENIYSTNKESLLIQTRESCYGFLIFYLKIAFSTKKEKEVTEVKTSKFTILYNDFKKLYKENVSEQGTNPLHELYHRYIGKYEPSIMKLKKEIDTYIKNADYKEANLLRADLIISLKKTGKEEDACLELDKRLEFLLNNSTTYDILELESAIKTSALLILDLFLDHKVQLKYYRKISKAIVFLCSKSYKDSDKVLQNYILPKLIKIYRSCLDILSMEDLPIYVELCMLLGDKLYYKEKELKNADNVYNYAFTAINEFVKKESNITFFLARLYLKLFKRLIPLTYEENLYSLVIDLCIYTNSNIQILEKEENIDTLLEYNSLFCYYHGLALVQNKRYSEAKIILNESKRSYDILISNFKKQKYARQRRKCIELLQKIKKRT